MRFFSQTRNIEQAIVVAANVRRVIRDSATPAQDLLVMVNNGELTAHKAWMTLCHSGRKVNAIRGAAAEEIDNLRKLEN